jgi:signal transduction histidine kinase
MSFATRVLHLRTVRARLTLWNVLTLGLVLVILAGVLRTITGSNLLSSVDVDLRQRSIRHVAYWANVPSASHETHAPERIEKDPQLAMRRTFGGMAPEIVRPGGSWRTPVAERVFDLNGVQSFPTYHGQPPWDLDAFRRAVQGQAGFSMARSESVPLRIYSAPLRRKSGEMAGVVQIASGMEHLETAMGNLDRALLMLLPLGLIAAWFSGMFLTGRALRPVRRITQAAGRIGARDLSERLPVSGDDEFSELAATMNTMLGRLEHSFEQQRRFTADASHELRTPLTVVKSVASRLLSKKDLPEEYRPSMERLDRAAAVMDSVVSDLLLLARSDAGQMELHVSPQPLSCIIDAALACVPLGSGPAIRNKVSEGSLSVMGDQSQLSRLFANLLNNAVRHTPSSGSITISARQVQGRVVVTVADTGTGIAAAHLPHVTERFYRVDTARTRAEGGTGLGLAICKTIADAHGGHMEIASVEGMGTSVNIGLPAVVAPTDLGADLQRLPATSNS